MRFWALSVLFHLGFFAAFFYLKPDFMRPDLREKIDGDVLVIGLVYEAPITKNNVLIKPIETDKQTASKSLREQVRLVSEQKVLTKPARGSVKDAATRAPVEKNAILIKLIEEDKETASKSLRKQIRSVSKQKVLPKPARESVKVLGARVPEGSAHSGTKIFETKKVYAKKHHRVAPGVLQLNESSGVMAAATTPIVSSAISTPRNKACISKSRLGAKKSREQNKSKENQQITIINLVGMHPAYRAVLQGQVASISALLGNKPLGRQPNIVALLNGGKNQSAQISCK